MQEPPAVTPDADARVGLSCAQKARPHKKGQVEAVFPSGYRRIEDPQGVLRIRLAKGGQILHAGASHWYVA